MLVDFSVTVIVDFVTVFVSPGVGARVGVVAIVVGANIAHRSDALARGGAVRAVPVVVQVHVPEKLVRDTRVGVIAIDACGIAIGVVVSVGYHSIAVVVVGVGAIVLYRAGVVGRITVVTVLVVVHVVRGRFAGHGLEDVAPITVTVVI